MTTIFLTIATTILIGYLGGVFALMSVAFLRASADEWRDKEYILAGMCLMMGLLPSMMLLAIVVMAAGGAA